jgi:hypothetical protein
VVLAAAYTAAHIPAAQLISGQNVEKRDAKFCGIACSVTWVMKRQCTVL